MDIGPALVYRPEAAQGHQMFPADKQGQFIGGQNLFRAGLDILKGHLRTAEAQLQIAAVEDGTVGEILALVGTVRLQTEAFVAHGGRAEAGAGAKAGGGVKGSAEEDDLCLFKRTITADKGLNIGGHHSTSSSIRSRNAGRKKAPAWRRSV